MKSKEIVISKKLAYGIGIGLIILAALLLLGGKLSIPGFGQSNNTSDANLVAGSPEKFAMLSERGTQDSVGST